MAGISVIILTKNRAELLTKNLNSLTKQSIQPEQIIIVDNGSTDNTPKVIKSYRKLLPLETFHTCLKGYPQLYNFGIKKAKGKLICFLDDDCLAEKNWLYYLIKMHRQYPQAVIQGQTFSLPKDNLYAQIMGDHYQNWLKTNLVNNQELRFLDNKNAAIPKKILDRVSGFSEKFSVGSEDLELANRLGKNGVKIIFQPMAVAWHHERTTLREFLKQHYRIAQSEALLNIKLFPPPKSLANLKSGLRREFNYLLNFKIWKAIQLPIAYIALFFIRLAGQKASAKDWL